MDVSFRFDGEDFKNAAKTEILKKGRKMRDSLGTDYYEFGLFDGDSFHGKVGNGDYRWCFGFDSFVGLPKEVDGLGKDGSLPHAPKETEGVYSLVKGIGDQTYNGSVLYSSFDKAVDVLTNRFLKSGDNFSIIPKFYSELTSKDVKKYGMKPAKYVYMDCDLYVSAKDALEFLIQNDLLVAGTIITYDDWNQYISFNYPEFEGGVSKAHKEISEKYNIEWDKFNVCRFRYKKKG